MINKKLLKSHKFVCPTDHTIVLPIILFSSYFPTLYSLLKYNEAFCALFVLPQSPQGCKISICSTSSQRIKLSRKITKKKLKKISRKYISIVLHSSLYLVLILLSIIVSYIAEICSMRLPQFGKLRKKNSSRNIFFKYLKTFFDSL